MVDECTDTLSDDHDTYNLLPNTMERQLRRDMAALRQPKTWQYFLWNVHATDVGNMSYPFHDMSCQKNPNDSFLVAAMDG